MFSFICRPELYGQIRRILLDRGNILYESASVNQDIRQCLEEAGRVNSSVLILDADAGAGDIITGIKRFRVTRPFARIIAIAPGREPGDPIVAGLIRRGIYDIIAPLLPDEEEGEEIDITADLIGVLDSKPASYADIVRWDIEEDKPVKEAISERERIVYMERLVGTGHIVVAGARRGSGCTTAAISLSHYLAQREKKNVAYMEICEYPIAHRVENYFHDRVKVFSQLDLQKRKETGSCIYNPINQLKKFEQIDYIVMDLGAIHWEPKFTWDYGVTMHNQHIHFQETYRADQVVLVLGTASWSVFDLAFYQRKYKDDLPRWTILTEKNSTAFVKKGSLSKNVYSVPDIKNPFKINEDWEYILAPVLPKKPKKRFSLFGRR